MNVGKAQQLWQKREIWLGVAAIALAGLGLTVGRTFIQAQLQRPATEEVAPVPQQVTVAALGRLEPAGEVVNVSGPTGERLSRLVVAEGDWAQPGDPLAYLENYAERLAERDYAASQLAEAQASLRAETQFGEAQIQEAQTRLQQIDKPQSFEIQAQQANIRRLEAELSAAQVDLNRFQNLQREGAVSQQDLDRQQIGVRRLQEELSGARANLVRLETSRDSNLSNARAQLQSAQADLTRSQAQTQVESALRNLELANARLERTIIRAPKEGQVLRVLTRPGEAIGEQGILQMGNTRQMYAVAEVYETDVGLVKVGQLATITSRNGAFDTQLQGRVDQIGRQIFKNNILDDDPAANADARVVEVKVRLDQSEPVAALTNLQVDVRIDVDASAQRPPGPIPSPNSSAQTTQTRP